MMYLAEIQTAAGDPETLEMVYQRACRAQEEGMFRDALLACHAHAPDNVLYAAWYHRLRHSAAERERAANWKLAIPLGVLAGTIFWLLSGERLDLPEYVPYLALVWAPVATCFVMAYLAGTSGKGVMRSAILGVCLLIAAGYATLFVVVWPRGQYQLLMILHLPLLAWIGCGISILGWGSGHRERFAFIKKSIEVFITGGLYVGAGGAFAAITIGMFQALGISLPEAVMRLLFGGGFGLIPVLAVASAYDPRTAPIGQVVQRGLARIVSNLMYLMLPLTAVVLAIYLLVIPFNFIEPFRNRDVLIVYNVMLFAVMGLLIAATPVQESDLPAKRHATLRIGILAVALLATLVSLYALSATVYRTVLGGFTLNRLTTIGWNAINIGILGVLIYKQLKRESMSWIHSLQTVFSRGTTVYAVWALLLIVVVPLFFA